MHIIEKNINKPWTWLLLSYNKHITMEFIKKYPKKPWNCGWVSRNLYKEEKDEFILKKYKEYLAAYKIQQFYFHRRLNPIYALCRNQVNRFYDNYIAI